MTLPLNTPKERETAIKNIIHDQAGAYTAIHTSLTDFAIYAHLVKNEQPAYFRIISMFLQHCEQHFSKAVAHTNKALAIAKESQHDILKALDEVNQSNSKIKELLTVLTVNKDRTKGDIINDYAEKLITFTEFGYLPMAQEVTTCDKEVAALFIEGTLCKIKADFPKMSSFYSPESVPSINSNIAAIKRGLDNTYGNNIVNQADNLAHLMTRTNNCIMNWLNI